MQLSYLILLAAVISCASACTSPKLTNLATYTTRENTVMTDTVFLAEFGLQCKEGLPSTDLYADILGQVVTLSYNSETSSYQMSWVAPSSEASGGSYPVRIFNEEGRAALNKALRNGQSSDNVQHLLTFAMEHPGVWGKPFIYCELIAVALAGFVLYTAHSARRAIEA